MSGALTHSPADVLRRVLIALGFGTAPEDDPLGSWPIYAAYEPDLPDNVITLYDTAGVHQGRDMITGEVFERHGVQLRIRSTTHPLGYQKTRALAVALDESIYQESVTLDDPGVGTATSYLVHAVSRRGILALGKDVPGGKRSVFTVNALVSVREV